MPDDQNNNQDPVQPTDLNQNPAPVNPQQEETLSQTVPSFTQVDSSSETPSIIPTVEETPSTLSQQPEENEQGTSAPSFDVPPIITPPEKPKKKFIATILGVLLLVGGIGAGVILLKQQQDIRTKAGACCTPGGPVEYGMGCEPPYYCVQTGVENCDGGWECKLSGGGTSPTNPPTSPTNPPTSPTNPPTSAPVVSCLNIKAYDTNWVELSASQLSLFKAGDEVRFTVKGSASSGSFNKARFAINGAAAVESTTKKPETEEFYYEYTIPAGTISFTIDAQVHHTSSGWI